MLVSIVTLFVWFFVFVTVFISIYLKLSTYLYLFLFLYLSLHSIIKLTVSKMLYFLCLHIYNFYKETSLPFLYFAKAVRPICLFLSLFVHIIVFLYSEIFLSLSPNVKFPSHSTNIFLHYLYFNFSNYFFKSQCSI